jgi:hypothetical protein
MTIRNSPSGPSAVTFTGLVNQTVAALAAAGDTLTQSIAVPDAKVGDIALTTSAALDTAGVVPAGPGVCAVAGTILQAYVATKAYAGAANVDFNVAVFHTG